MALPFIKSRTDRRRAEANDPASLLILDHEKAERLFKAIKHASEPNARAGLVAQLEAELTRHMAIEEQVLYPFIRRCVPDGDTLVDEAEGEHDQARQTLARVATLDPATPEFEQALAELEHEISHHVNDEEKELFPKLGESTPNPRLAELRGDLERARMAQTPNPNLPQATKTKTKTKAKPALGRSAVWVQPHHTEDGRWQVRREHATRASRVFDRQKDAEAFGRQLARREAVEFVLAGRDGSIRAKDTPR